ncbi:MAG TPA: hypothetical protein VL989_00910 [Candidatus Sulfotelmatobacter sp.]|nr:hypothetical protein [Candidatus Sulfotelmatobacter sp.]
MNVSHDTEIRVADPEDRSLEYLQSASHMAHLALLYIDPSVNSLRSGLFRNGPWQFYQKMYPSVDPDDILSTRVIAKMDERVFIGIQGMKHYLPYDESVRRTGGDSEVSSYDIDIVRKFANGGSLLTPVSMLSNAEAQEWVPTEPCLRRYTLGMASGMRVLAAISGTRDYLSGTGSGVSPYVEDAIVDALQLSDEEQSVVQSLEFMSS